MGDWQQLDRLARQEIVPVRRNLDHKTRDGQERAAMSEREAQPPRRLRAVPVDTYPETAESLLPGLPRVGALDALLREVDGLRLSLETDLELAAAAVEAGSPQVAADLVDRDREGLRAFEARALAHLADLADDDLEPFAPPAQVRRRWWTRVPAAPFVAAAAIVGFLVGVVPHTQGTGPTPLTASPASASRSLEQLTQLAALGQTAQVRDAATELHSQLMSLVAEARTNPAAARQGLLLLSAERAVIAQSGDSAVLGDVLAESAQLSKMILSALPAGVLPTAPPVVVAVPTPVRQASQRPTTTASSKPATTSGTGTRATPAAQSTPAATPQPSSSPSGGPGVLPTAPAFAP
jgi:hypothetical protein